MKHIVITGASSGIGEALALEYAQGGVKLSLSARNLERLKSVAENCRAKGALVEERQIDVMDRDAMKQWLLSLDHDHPIDLLIANAGISGGLLGDTDWEEATRDIFAVNMVGVLNTILPLIPFMVNRGQGQIALVSSLAGFRGLGTAPAYSASKVFVKGYGEALRMKYQNTGLKINIICPGFVKSRITDQNDFKMPFFMQADRAAKIIAKNLAKDKAIIAFPWQMALITRVMSLLPYGLVARLMRNMPSKE